MFVVSVFLAVQLTESRWAAMLACPKVTAPGTAEGTGVVIGVQDGFAYVLTAAHVAPSDLVTLKFTSRANYPKAAWFGDGAKVIGCWPDPDFALIKFPVGKRVVPIIPLAPAWDRPKAFPAAVLSVGVGSGPASTVWSDVILGKEFVRREGKGPAFFWRTKVAPEPGRSGGPLLDGKGRVIGITVAFRGDVGYYSHHDEILAALKRDGFGSLIPTPKP
ncbi:MAG: serine protease [Planctomycetes bacterium]|nr:serine protease [Planctomycetota bacterium]